MTTEEKLLEYLLGSGGSLILKPHVIDSDIESELFHAYTNLKGIRIIVQENTEFDMFEIDGVDYLNAYGLNNYICKAGAVITVPRNKFITAINLVSGSAILYNDLSVKI